MASSLAYVITVSGVIRDLLRARLPQVLISSFINGRSSRSRAKPDERRLLGLVAALVVAAAAVR